MGGIKKGMEVSGEYLFYCDIKMPAGMTGDIIGRLISLDACGKELTQPQDIVISATETAPQRVYKFAPVFQDITLVTASEQPDPQRYTLYRTEKSIMALDCILEEGKVPSDYNVIVHHIDPMGKVRFELVTTVPPGEPNKKNPQAPAMERDIAGIKLNGSLPSFSIVLGTSPRMTLIFPDDIQAGTLEVVRDDGNDATEDEVVIPSNLFRVQGNRVESLSPLPEFPVGTNRIVATATSVDGASLRQEANVFIYSSEKYTYFIQSSVLRTILTPVVQPLTLSTSWLDVYAKDRILLVCNTFLEDFSISKILRRHCVKPVGLERTNGVICGSITGVRDNFELGDVIFENDIFNVSEIPGAFGFDSDTGGFNYLFVSTKFAESINLSAFVDFPPSPQFKPMLGVFDISSLTLTAGQPVEGPLRVAIHNAKGDFAVQDLKDGTWYDFHELKQLGVVREEEREGVFITIVYFNELPGKPATPLGGVDLAFIYVHNLLPHWDDPGLALVARTALRENYDLLLGNIEQIVIDIKTKNWVGIGVCIACYAIPGITGKVVKKVSNAVKKAILLKRYKGRISGALRKRFGKEAIEDLTNQELNTWFKECEDRFSGLPAEVCEDLGFQSMQLSVKKKGWQRFTLTGGKPWQKYYHGFDDLRQDALGNIVICEAKAGSSKLDVFEKVIWGNKPARNVTQMDSDWVRFKIDEMLQGNDLDKEAANTLLSKWREGKLKGTVFFTPIEKGVVGQTWEKELIDYGTQPPW
jgi:hypothetical protein